MLNYYKLTKTAWAKGYKTRKRYLLKYKTAANLLATARPILDIV